MRFKKIRGHSRIQREIQSWVDVSADLDVKRVKEFNYQYIKIHLLPWMNKPTTNSDFKEPNKLTKKSIINGLETIYDSWRFQLEKLNEPYYLKIWLNESRVSKSEVVCAIKGKIEEFENSFHKIDCEGNKSNITNQMNLDFKWECAVDEDFISENEVSQENFLHRDEFFSERRLLNKAIKKGYRSKVVENSSGEKEKVYFIPKGKIWIGEK